MYSNPSILQFKLQFLRDFPFGTNISDNVLDSDITSAFQYTNININQDLFADQATYTLGYNLMAAHFLVLNIRASSQGINGQYNWLQQSKGAGAVNEAFAIPQRVLDNPFWSQMYKTNYGAQFMLLVLPQLQGAMTIAFGTTLP